MRIKRNFLPRLARFAASLPTRYDETGRGRKYQLIQDFLVDTKLEDRSA